MRKIVLILLSLFCCLLSMGGSGSVSAAVVPQAQTQLSVDRSGGNVWLCEQQCNSDLGMPRVPGQLASVPVFCTPLRASSVEGEREAFRAVIPVRGSGGLKAASRCVYFETLACAYAVDYYVYRLRKLLI